MTASVQTIAQSGMPDVFRHGGATLSDSGV